MRKHPTPNIQHPTPNEGSASGIYTKGEAGPRRQTEANVASSKRFDLEERMLLHASRIVALYDSLPARSGAKQIGNQLIRSGTSPYLHHGEVEAAESLDDFVHKLKVCLKELRETWRALRLLLQVGGLRDKSEGTALIDETQQLIRIFYQSIRTARSRSNDRSRVKEDASDPPHWMLDVGCWMLDVSTSDAPSDAEARP
ncbi:MAG TPA: four helix bundle protein [Chthoniobacteraceae bacterium]|nr:four helix bundle protein [Chthoniobacteraceae bacterium]